MLISSGIHFFEIMFSFPSSLHDMFIEIKDNYLRFPFFANRQFLSGVLYWYLHLHDDCSELSISSYPTTEYLASIIFNRMNNIFKLTAIMATFNFWVSHTSGFLKSKKKYIYIKLYWMCPLSTKFNGVYWENNNSFCDVNCLNCETSKVFGLSLLSLHETDLTIN